MDKTKDMAKKTSALDGFIYLASKLPWWISLALALASGLYLHSVASAPVPMTFDSRHFDSLLIQSALRSMATLGQFLLPLIFIGGAIASVAGRRKRRGLLNAASAPGGSALRDISWREFELLVGETLRRQGFTVQETGGDGPDGGVDLIARKAGEKYLVQCKHWRSQQVGVPVVRELYGAMAALGAVGGFIVTSGTFSKPAREFAHGRNLQLVDGTLLKQWTATAQQAAPPSRAEKAEKPVEPAFAPEKSRSPAVQKTPSAPAQPEAPACPHCRKQMVIKVARTGPNAGGNFWGCADYPKCRGIRPIFAGGHFKKPR